jgi:hypothetical protein
MDGNSCDRYGVYVCQRRRHPMKLDELKRQLQNHLTDGLVIIAGSGLSAAAGMSGMPQLAAYLLQNVPIDLPSALQADWQKVADALSAGKTLEEALLATPSINETLETRIINLTAALIDKEERQVVQEVIAGTKKLPISQLFDYLFRVSENLSVITSNYDRLIELGAEIGGYGLDTMFTGQHYGPLNKQLSREALGTAVRSRSRKEIIRTYRKHVRLFKPHGSLDWYTHNMSPIRCSLSLELPRLMIAPGATKYLRGYNQPFDVHREEANKAIDNAACFLVIGYGFNDQQLETHLRTQLKRGIPCVVLTRSISSNALSLMGEVPSMIVLSQPKGGTGTQLDCNGTQVLYPDIQLWELGEFVQQSLTL